MNPSLFTSGQLGQRKVQLISTEKKSLGPGDDMYRTVSINDCIGQLGQGSSQRHSGIELFPILVKIHRTESFGPPQVAFIWLDLPG